MGEAMNMEHLPRDAKMTPSEVMGEAHMPHDQHRINEAVERRASIRRQARNQTYRALVSLVAAVAKVYGDPREALEMLKDELGKIEKDVIKAEKKVARRAKGNTDLEAK